MLASAILTGNFSRIAFPTDSRDMSPVAAAKALYDDSTASAVLARALVEAILASPTRGDRLGQNVRNLFECLGLPEEGAELALQCGESPDSPLR